MKKIQLTRTHKIILLSLAGLVVLVFLGAWIIKGWLMDKAVSRMQEKLHSKYGLSLTFKDYGLQGFSHVNLEGIKCLTRTQDTLLYFDKVTVDIRLLPALIGRLRLKQINASDGLVDIGRLRQMKGTGHETTTDAGDTTRFGKIKKYLGYLDEAAAVMPSDFDVKNLRLNYDDSLDHLTAHIDSMSYHNSQIASAIRMRIKGREQQWGIHGMFNKNNLKTDVGVSTDDTTFYNFSMIKKLAKADIGVRNFHFRLDNLDNSENEIDLEGSAGANGILFYNERLADDTIRVNKGEMAYKLRLTPDKIDLLPGSSVSMNQVKGSITGEYVYKGHETVSLKLNMPPVPAQELVNSFPSGTFNSVQGMKIDGKFSYKFNFYFDISKKDSILIDSDLDGSPDLHVTQWGEANLSKLAGTFTYLPYNSKRPIVVGPSNPKFTPLNQISPFLRNAVITSEDPTFYHHHGFVEEALEQSFIKNVKTGEFSRGGSTISMQLIKNVFLTHKKTIERKIEEAFLVWMMENMHIVDKQRILEVYLNIIEWGPKVYGVGEAAPFYFNTTPANLTLSEAAYLAVIIPQPLGFEWKFDSQGNLKDYMQNRIDFITHLMELRGMVSQDQYLDSAPSVFISGPARDYLKIEPAQPDTTQPDEFDWKDILDMR